MKRFFAALALVALLIPASASALKLPSQSIEAIRDNEGNIHCTAFSINQKEHLWMTARHCVLDENGKLAKIYIGVESAMVYKLFGDMDAAIVKTIRASAPALKMAKNEPKLLDSVYVIGHGYGFERLTVFQGKIANLEVDSGWDQLYMLFDMFVFPGHSGSPVLTPDNKVVSIMQIRIGQSSGGCRWIDLQQETGQYWEK